MLNCIIGVLLCAHPVHNANMTIPGKLTYAAPGQAYAWNYAAYYSVPIQAPLPVFFPVTRRG